ncbi:hypothetical protein WJ32_18850 (plasmid) [Burkholderia ubonensis]|uniref:Abortive infection protein-like C-terminal domain-containing protein n=1 Tax=Burkholderia ubonensis TaxID=101571 RepID=A0A103QP75_9BURK|nr:hypothetical protein WJ32_18850 [Burkholderia ubonensis]KVG53023.1 hypothetical protein WJ33_08505 [Burkholderia ubonensis]
MILMDNSISALTAHRQLADQKAAALLQRVEALTADLTSAVGAQPVSAVSDIANLDQRGEDEWIYGKLRFADGRLTVLYRYSADDEADAHYGVAPEDRWWNNVELTKCKQQWREKMMDDAVLQSLINRIKEALVARAARIDASLAAVQKVLEAESSTLDAAMTASVDGFGSATLAEHWHDVLAKLPLDTPDTLAATYSMFETLCSAILHERQVTPKSRDRSLQFVLRECVDELAGADPAAAKQAGYEILKTFQGLSSGLGALRNRFSSAHGTLPGTVPLDPAYAMLAKNAVATAAIFLLSRHQANPPARRAGDAPSGPGAI